MREVDFYIDWVLIDTMGDGLYIMYVNGRLYGWGDSYHWQGYEERTGFLAALKMCNKDYVLKRWETDDPELIDEYCCSGGRPPATLEMIQIDSEKLPQAKEFGPNLKLVTLTYSGKDEDE